MPCQGDGAGAGSCDASLGDCEPPPSFEEALLEAGGGGGGAGVALDDFPPIAARSLACGVEPQDRLVAPQVATRAGCVCWLSLASEEEEPGGGVKGGGMCRETTGGIPKTDIRALICASSIRPERRPRLD